MDLLEYKRQFNSHQLSSTDKLWSFLLYIKLIISQLLLHYVDNVQENK